MDFIFEFHIRLNMQQQQQQTFPNIKFQLK